MTDDRDDLRKHLSDQAHEMDGASWISIPLDMMSKRELIGVIAHMRRNDEQQRKCYRKQLEFRRSLRR